MGVFKRRQITTLSPPLKREKRKRKKKKEETGPRIAQSRGSEDREGVSAYRLKGKEPIQFWPPAFSIEEGRRRERRKKDRLCCLIIAIRKKGKKEVEWLLT